MASPAGIGTGPVKRRRCPAANWSSGAGAARCCLAGQADGAREDARRVALSLLQASQAAGRSGAGCPAAQAGGFAWPWDERIEPDKPKVPSPQVSAVRVAGLAENANCSQPIRRGTAPGRL